MKAAYRMRISARRVPLQTRSTMNAQLASHPDSREPARRHCQGVTVDSRQVRPYSGYVRRPLTLANSIGDSNDEENHLLVCGDSPAYRTPAACYGTTTAAASSTFTSTFE